MEDFGIKKFIDRMVEYNVLEELQDGGVHCIVLEELQDGGVQAP